MFRVCLERKKSEVKELCTTTYNKTIAKEMPEALIKGMMDVSANDADQETIILPAEQKWGFRLTGGSEFSMPVTVFQVSINFMFYDCF